MKQNTLSVQIPSPEAMTFAINANQYTSQDSQLIFLEELAPTMERQFQKSILTPYFKAVFSDLILRSASASEVSKSSGANDQQTQKQTIDKVTFLEYANLPGVLNDQFLAIVMQQSSDSNRITEIAFINVMFAVFASDLKSKLRIVFRMFDFSQRGSLNYDDVRLLMSYIPLRHKSLPDSNSNASSFSANSASEKKKRSGSSLGNSPKKGSEKAKFEQIQQAEGLFTEGPTLNEAERVNNQLQVDQFVQTIFEAATSTSNHKNAVKNYQMTFEDFTQMNTNVSSEMFISIMSIFHERLPCALYYFKQRKLFIERQIEKQSKAFLENQSASSNVQQPQKSNSVDRRKVPKDPVQVAIALEKAEQVVFQPYKAIASPRLIKNWSGSPKLGGNRISNFGSDNCGSSGQLEESSSFNLKNSNVQSLGVNQQEDPRQPQQFIIRKNTGSFNKGSPRLQALSVSRVIQSPQSQCVSGGAVQQNSLGSQNSTNSLASCTGPAALNQRSDSPVVFVTQSKMRRLNEAKREWEGNHTPNSPFRVEKFKKLSSSSLDCVDNCESGVVTYNNNNQSKVHNLSCNSPVLRTSNNSSAQSIEQASAKKDVAAKSTFNRTSSNANGSGGSQYRSRNAFGSTLSSKTNGDANSSNMGSPMKGNSFDKRKLPALGSIQQDSAEQLNESTNESDFASMSGQTQCVSIKTQSPVVDAFYDISTNSKMHIRLEGTCFLKTKADRFKSHWALLDGHEIYCYRFKDDQSYRVMHSLSGTFLEQMEPENCPDTHKKLYPVKIVLPPTKSRILYFESEDAQKLWQTRLKISMGYSNIFDFYETGYTLGKGQFGLVKFARHKKTKHNVAIKLVGKANMKPIEVLQQRREIEVLKMCQHRGIIKLIDVFENSSHYYIVLEYLAGKDLFDYLQKRSFSIKEERCKEIALQMVQSVLYLHAYGIVHRDLKLENIMMRDASDKAEPVVVDFGLSKIIGPEQTANEPFGTLGYAAPEVLKKQQYSFSCDIWSLGCILYALLSGSLPFDHESQRETIRMTFEDELRFDLKVWKTISPTCKQLLTAMLTKDPSKRIKLKEVAAHPWFDTVRGLSSPLIK